MSFTVRLYEFSKKENSTARPSGTGTEYDCTLVRGSGILAPVIELKLPLTQDPAAYNYAYIPNFERYYYISEWTFEGALWRAQMTVDALATWKGTIGSQSFYVLRSSAQKDGTIIDSMYPVKDTFSIAVQAKEGSSAAWWDDPATSNWTTNGYFILGILSYTGSNDMVGGINYIAILPGSMGSLLQEMFSDAGQFATKNFNVFDPISNYSTTQKANMLYVCENPYSDYIKSVTWVPDAPTIGDPVYTGFYLGKTLITGIPYKRVNIRDTKHYSATFQLPKHPLTNSRGTYVNCAPFTELFIQLPKLGALDLDPSYFASRNYLFVTLDIDPITGDGLYRVFTSDTNGLINAVEVTRFFSPVGVQVAITGGKEYGSKITALGNAISAALNVVGNPGSITAMPAAISSVIRAQKSAAPTIGDNGGWLGLQSVQRSPYLHAIFHDIAADDNSHNGRPLCQVKTPASLGGYMMIQDADIQAPATSQELATIKNYMESGFYYE